MDREADRLKQFSEHHICYDRKPHDRVEFSCTVSYSNASGIGTNTYIRCDRCGAGQEVTDYDIW